jgi:hypothetical protein
MQNNIIIILFIIILESIFLFLVLPPDFYFYRLPPPQETIIYMDESVRLVIFAGTGNTSLFIYLLGHFFINFYRLGYYY